MALIKRTVIVVSALATLTACAPAGYHATNSADTQPVANAAAETEPSATPAPEQPAAPPRGVPLTTKLISKKLPRMGQVVTDAKGWVLYRFDKDSAKPPTTNCLDACTKVWPPALTDGSPQLQGLTDEKVGTVNRPDGTRQLTVGGWPVYRYIGDKVPGQWKGQGVGNTWWVISPEGRKNLTCVPTSPPKAAVPPPDAGDAGGTSDDGGTAGSSTY